MTSELSYLNGITAIAIVAAGWIAGLRVLAINKRAPSKLLPWAALVLITFGSFYIGIVVYFIDLLATGTQFGPLDIGAWLCYSISPLAAASSMYLGCSLFKPKIAKLVFVIYFAIGMVYAILLWFFPSITVETSAVTGELIEISNIGIGLILMAGMILSLFVFLVGGFVNLAKKASGAQKKTAIDFAVGFGLFTVCAIGDALFGADLLLLFIIRLLMLTGFLFLFRAAARMSTK